MAEKQTAIDPEDALTVIRGTANMLNRLACGEGGSWAYDGDMFITMGRTLMEAAGAIEALLYGDGDQDQEDADRG